MLDRFSEKNAVLLHFGSYCTFTIFLLELVSYWLIPDSITILIVEVEVNHILFWHLINKPTFNNNNIKHFSFILWPVEDLKFQLSCGCHGDDGNLHNSEFAVNIFYVKKLNKSMIAGISDQPVHTLNCATGSGLASDMISLKYLCYQTKQYWQQLDSHFNN